MTNPCLTYDITLWNVEITPSDMCDKFRKFCRQFKFQKEECPSTKKLHYQCRVKLMNKIRKNQVIALLTENGMNPDGDRVTPTSSENITNYFYVMKDESRVDGPWSDETKPMPTDIQVIENEKQEWMETVIDSLELTDFRTINCVIEERGNIGKSMFCDWLVWHKMAALVPPTLPDANALLQYTYSLGEKRCYLIDLPRAMNQKKLAPLYVAIEEIKNGRLYDPRYGDRPPIKMRERPNIWVFANTLPNLAHLSVDKWKLWTVKDQKLIPYPLRNEENNISAAQASGGPPPPSL